MSLLGTRRRRGMAAVGVTVATALAVTGCEAASEGGGEPVEGGVLTIVQSADVSPTTLYGQNGVNFTLSRTVFNSLVTYDHETLEPQPELATAWELAPDGLSLTFELREDVTFHDGSDFTADDVIAGVQTVQRTDVSSQAKHIAAQVTDMEAVTDHELLVTLAHPMSNVMDLFMMMPIVEPSTIDALLAGEAFVGTGPFVVDEYNPGQGMSLVRNDDYWGGAAYLDGVDINIVQDSQSMLSSLKSGQTDVAVNLAPLDGASLQSDPGFELVLSEANDSVWYIGSNVTVPLLSDNRVRQAMAFAVDRERILEQVFGGVGQVTSLPWGLASPAWDDSLATYYSRDIDEAARLLEEAGATGETLNIYYNTAYAISGAIAEILEFDLREAGLDATLVPTQNSEFGERLRGGGFDGIFIGGHGFGQLNPATLLKGAFPFNADNNASSFDSDEYRELANELWTSPEATPGTLQAVNEFLLDQQFVSDLVLTTHTFAISTSVKGLDMTMLDYLILDRTYIQF